MVAVVVGPGADIAAAIEVAAVVASTGDLSVIYAVMVAVLGGALAATWDKLYTVISFSEVSSYELEFTKKDLRSTSYSSLRRRTKRTTRSLREQMGIL